MDLDRRPSLRLQRALMLRSVSLSRRDLVRHLLAYEPPPGLREVAALRHHAVIELEGGRWRLPGGTLVVRLRPGTRRRLRDGRRPPLRSCYPMSNPDRPSFDLLTRAWIPCIDRDGRFVEMGVLDALRRAHQLCEVRDPSPLVTYGIARLLLAIVQDAIDPKNPREWLDHFRRGSFGEAMIERVLARDNDRFDLFHPTHPFGQSGDWPTVVDRAARKDLTPTTVGRLRPEIPSDTNVNHFSHVYDEHFAMCPACTARGLATLSAFAKIDGRGYSASINGTPPVYLWLAGADLFESLVWNLALPNFQPNGPDRQGGPSWRGDGTVPSVQRPVAGFVDGLTWQPRKVRLLPAGPGDCTACGTASDVIVRQVLWGPGRSRPKEAPFWRRPVRRLHVGGG